MQLNHLTLNNLVLKQLKMLYNRKRCILIIGNSVAEIGTVNDRPIYSKYKELLQAQRAKTSRLFNGWTKAGRCELVAKEILERLVVYWGIDMADKNLLLDVLTTEVLPKVDEKCRAQITQQLNLVLPGINKMCREKIFGQKRGDLEKILGGLGLAGILEKVEGEEQNNLIDQLHALFVEKLKDCKENQSCGWALEKIPKNEILGFVSLLNCTNISIDKARDQIESLQKMIGRVPDGMRVISELLNMVSAKATALIKILELSREKVPNLLEIIKNVPTKEQKETLIDQLHTLFVDKLEEKTHIIPSCIEELKEIPGNEIADFVTLLNYINAPDYGFNSAVRDLKEIVKEKPDAVRPITELLKMVPAKVDALLKILKLPGGADAVSNLLEILKKVPTMEQKKTLIDQVLTFFVEGYRVRRVELPSLCEYLSSFQIIPENERVDFIYILNDLLLSDKGYKTEKFDDYIQFFKNCPVEERGIIANQAKSFLANFGSDHTPYAALNFVRAIPKETRNAFIDQIPTLLEVIRRLIPDTKNVENTGRVLNAVAKFPSQERETICTKTLALIDRWSDAEFKVRVLNDVAALVTKVNNEEAGVSRELGELQDRDFAIAKEKIAERGIYIDSIPHWYPGLTLSPDQRIEILSMLAEWCADVSFRKTCSISNVTPTQISEIAEKAAKNKNRVMLVTPELIPDENTRYKLLLSNLYNASDYLAKAKLNKEHAIDIAAKVYRIDLNEFDFTAEEKTEIERLRIFEDPNKVIEMQDLLGTPLAYLENSQRLLKMPSLWNGLTPKNKDQVLPLVTPSFKPIFEKHGEKNHYLLLQMEIKAKVLAEKHGFKCDGPEFKALAKLAKNFVELGGQEQWFTLYKSIMKAFMDRSVFERWYNKNNESGWVPHHLIPTAFFTALKPDEETYKKWEKPLLAHKVLFKDGKKFRLLTMYMNHIQGADLPNDRKYLLMDHLVHDPAKGAIFSRALLLSDILVLAPEFLNTKTMFPTEELKIVRRQGFLSAFSIGKVVDEKKIDHLLVSWRDPNALITYLGKIKELPTEESKPLAEHYGRWIESLLDDSFLSWRYDNSPQIKELISRGVSADLISKWKKGGIRQKIVLDAKPSDLGSVSSRLKDFLHTKLCVDKHVADFEQNYPAATKFLKGEPGPQIFEEDSLGAQIVSACQEGATDLNLRNLLDWAKEKPGFEQLCLDLREFNNKEQVLKAQPKVEKAFEILDSDDPQDLLLLASETGGCQTVYGSPHLNKCALAYVTDGKNRAIVIKDPKTHKTIARGVLRLLWDDQAKKPALFLERTYSSYPESRFDDKIREYADQLGQALNLAVYSTEDGKGECTLESFGSSAPFEYSDAGGGQTKGSFTIKQAKALSVR